MFADLQAEVAAPTIPVQQLPLGQLVRPELHHRPGRATDFIEALEADTDQFIAGMEDATGQFIGGLNTGW
jgi:hypothetical protein